jgi:hypothetical protein
LKNLFIAGVIYVFGVVSFFLFNFALINANGNILLNSFSTGAAIVIAYGCCNDVGGEKG